MQGVVVYPGVCVFVSSILAPVPSIKARRALHSTLCSASRGRHLFSVSFCPTITNRGHTGGGKRRGIILLLLLFFVAPSACGACLHFYRKKRSGVAHPRQQQNRICLITKLFSCRSLFTTRHESEKKHTLAEILEPVISVPYIRLRGTN